MYCTALIANVIASFAGAGIGQLDAGLSNHYQMEWRAANAHYLLGYNEPDPETGTTTLIW